MFNIRGYKDSRDKGMTLVEVLVAIFLLAIVGTIISGIVIAAIRLTRSTQSGVQAQDQLNDAVSRMTRDIAASDPILYTATNAGWSKVTPSSDDIAMQSVVNGKCVRTRYYVSTNGSTKTLKSETQTYSSSDCPDPRLPDTSTNTVTRTIIDNLKTTDDSGNQLPVFTYYASDDSVISPVTRASVNSIARVKIDVGSAVDLRSKGVRLTTSVAPRSIDNPLVTNVPPPSCSQANLTVTPNGADPSTPVITWSYTENADKFILNRASLVVQNGIYTTTSNPPAAFYDTTMRGYWGTVITYTLNIEGPGGIVQCSKDYMPPPAPALGSTTVAGTVTPDTSTAPGNVTNPAVNLTWPSIPKATTYDVYRRPIDPNVAPYNATGTGSWSYITTTPSLSYTQTPGFDVAYEYKVVGRSTDYTPVITGPDSNGVKALTHTAASNLTGVPVTYNQNRLTWTQATGATVDGYALWRKANGTSTWTKIWETSNTSTLTYTDTTPELSSLYDYIVTDYNDGPRGTQYSGTTRYYGQSSNVVTVLQYPLTPATDARGTESNNAYNPDGRDSVQWAPVATATSYKVYQYNDDGVTQTSVNNVGNNTYTTYGSEPRGSRDFFMAVACNATGCSKNDVDSSLRPAATDDAYQRPANQAPTVGSTATDSCNQVAASSTNQVYNCDTNATTIGWNQNADAGEGSDKFCLLSGNPGGCQYITTNNNSGVASYPTQTTSTYSGGPSNGSNYYLYAGQTLSPGQALYSTNNSEQLVMQTDGNLVLYGLQNGAYNKVIWASGTNGYNGSRLIMQTDGNLVIYTPSNYPIWYTRTDGTGSSNALVVQTDGNLVVYRTSPSVQALWQTATSWTGTGTPPGAGTTTTENATQSQVGSASNWGVTDQVGLIGCNNGGCADIQNTPVRSYPGPFGITSVGLQNEEIYSRWANGWNGDTINYGKAQVYWSGSTGAYQYRSVTQPLADDPLGRTWDATTTSNDSGQRDVAPGASYNTWAYSYATNGLQRGTYSNFQTAPALVGFLQDTAACNTSYNGWKEYFRVRRGGLTWGGAGTYMNSVHASYLVNRYYGGWSDELDYVEYAFNYSPPWRTPLGNWDYGDNSGNRYFQNSYDGVTNSSGGDEAFGDTQNSGYRISDNVNSGGTVGERSHVDRSGNHNTAFGRWDSERIAVVSYKTDGNSVAAGKGSCGSGSYRQTQYNPSIGRRASFFSNAHQDPNATGWSISG